jgi:hypothetical protein
MFRSWVWLFLSLALLISPFAAHGWATNNRADPFPLYTTLDPQTFNYIRHKQIVHGWPLDKAAPERVTLSLSGFGQAANSTRAPCGGVLNASSPTGTCVDLPLGDIDGHWNMLALLFGQQPHCQTFGPLLTQAFQALFPGYQPGQINDNFSYDIDTCSPDLGFHQYGSFANFSNYLKYHKYGIRWDFEAQLIGDFGFQFQGGIADITQTLTMRIDLTNTCSASQVDCGGSGTPCNYTTPITGALVKQYLMDRVDDIARELCLDICSYHAISIEDLYFCLYWRHAHEVNFKRDPSWSQFLAIPFIRIAGSVPSGKSKDPAVMFSVPFTNNGHPSIDVNAGINLDFTDTVEIGAEFGYSHFFARDVCGLHLPNSTFQSGIFPFQTTANVQPGDSWYGAAKINAYHFLDRLSFWGQWVIIKHKEDTIRLIDCDPAFITANCPTSEWSAQFINAAFTYDCSPNVAIGFVWQFPTKWVRAYKSNTVLFSFVASF